jgi:hypothetical protein
MGRYASSRYYIVTHARVPKGYETNDYQKAREILIMAQETDRNAYIIDNVDFGKWPPK